MKRKHIKSEHLLDARYRLYCGLVVTRETYWDFMDAEPALPPCRRCEGAFERQTKTFMRAREIAGKPVTEEFARKRMLALTED